MRVQIVGCVTDDDKKDLQREAELREELRTSCDKLGFRLNIGDEVCYTRRNVFNSSVYYTRAVVLGFDKDKVIIRLLCRCNPSRVFPKTLILINKTNRRRVNIIDELDDIYARRMRKYNKENKQ